MGLLLSPVTFARVSAPPDALQATVPGEVEVERVIVTGSNIPSAEEVGPDPVDTYRPADIERLGVRNSTDLLAALPQMMGSTANQNAVGTSDGSVIPNLRGLLPKETLVLIDGKRVAIAGMGAVFVNGISQLRPTRRGHQSNSLLDD